jgi:hypothetical protein
MVRLVAHLRIAWGLIIIIVNSLQLILFSLP